jgi:hypothetical protein
LLREGGPVIEKQEDDMFAATDGGEEGEPRRKTVCVRCGYRITWAEQRKQFGRAIKRYGLTPEAAKALMPGRQVCLTSTLARGRPTISD